MSGGLRILIRRCRWCCLHPESRALSFPGCGYLPCLCSAVFHSSLFLHPMAITGIDLHGRNYHGQAVSQPCSPVSIWRHWESLIKWNKLSFAAVTTHSHIAITLKIYILGATGLSWIGWRHRSSMFSWLNLDLQIKHPLLHCCHLPPCDEREQDGHSTIS